MQDLWDALGYVGSSLDKLGPRPLRGLLAGHPRELASIVPFSDKLGLTDPEEVQRGRDVTNKFGITRPGDTGMGSDAAGMMAEMLLDPVGLAVGGYGALKGAQGAVKGAGLAHRGLMGAAEARLPARARMGFNDFLPFPRAERAVNQGADWLGPNYPMESGRNILHAALGERGPRDQINQTLESLTPGQRMRIYREIPPGSTTLTRGGAEGPVLKSPYGSVIKVSPTNSLFGAMDEAEFMAGQDPRLHIFPGTGRADIPESLRPIRSHDFGPPGAGVRVEHLHEVNPMMQQTGLLHQALAPYAPHALANPEMHGDWLKAKASANRMEAIDRAMGRKLQGSIERQNPYLSAFDVDPRNISTTPAGNLVVHDAGAVVGRRPRGGTPWHQIGSHVPVTPYPTPGRPGDELYQQLLDMGSEEKVRTGLESMARGGPGDRGVRPPRYATIPHGLTANEHITDPMGMRNEHLDQIHGFLRRYAHILGRHPSGVASSAGPGDIDALLRAIGGT